MITNHSSVSVVPFHWAHVRMMDLRPFEQMYFQQFPDYDVRLKLMGQHKHSYTALVRGEIACCWGAMPIWEGVAEAWLLTSYKVETNPIALTRGAIRYFNIIYSDMQLHRLQIVVDCRNTIAMRWARALKFTEEGTMRGYGPDGADHIMFARTG